ncbi:probable prolyl 4-hydroxylase 3 [Coffea eugenioides]|uniref:probable prolyl 4-hydroxylase 3 n=1 Tax=Coffea eugenioides TaxID=49369 RepID=UPI000F615A59|nr:probable prolyl 4-hydroxylase 3 [Coffea eugenioides]
MAVDIVEGGGLGQRRKQWTEVLSSEPRASIFHNFLSKEECEYLINLAKPRMSRSKVLDPNTGQTGHSSSRTSTRMHLKRGHDEVVRDIERRIANYTSIPVENGEGLSVINYEVGQKFEPHHDVHRMATLLMYLSDVEEGGETYFPNAIAKRKCCRFPGCTKRRGLYVKPKMGDALFFWTLKPDRITVDPSSLHGGRPVIRGDKWACIKWMHAEEFKASKTENLKYWTRTEEVFLLSIMKLDKSSSLTHHDGYGRMATVLIYLSDVEEGGETYFPNAREKFSRVRGFRLRSGLYVKPKMRHALFFWTLKHDLTTVDPSSLHVLLGGELSMGITV